MYLLKHIALTGNYPSRKIERLIFEKKITVNGRIAVRSTKVKEGDLILIDGEPLKPRTRTIFLAYNKPVGVTCTTEENIQNNIISRIDYPERIFPVGRLDKDSEGLILLTNDGETANRILHSDNEHEKEYIVQLKQPAGNRFVIAELAAGIDLLGTRTKPCTVEQLNDHTLRFVLKQGLNRQIRRMCEAVGMEVAALKRVRVMNILLGDLPTGSWRELDEEEKKKLTES